MADHRYVHHHSLLVGHTWREKDYCCMSLYIVFFRKILQSMASTNDEEHEVGSDRLQPWLSVHLYFLCVWTRQVRVWEIPEDGLRRNMTEAVLELYGHSRRVGLIEWHPTSSGILFSAGYDYKVPHQYLQTQQDGINTVFSVSMMSTNDLTTIKCRLKKNSPS